jgi:hypothetical protein
LLAGKSGTESARAHAYQGYAYLQMGKLTEAGKSVDRAIAVSSQDWGWPFYIRYLVRQKQGLAADAASNLREASRKGCTAVFPVNLSGLGER